jgi:magnesium chelatase family protein
VRRYNARISGPLLDRIDLVVHVPAVPVGDLMDDPRAERSEHIMARVGAARSRQRARSGGVDGGALTNAELGPTGLRRTVRITPETAALLRRATDRLGLSARGLYRVLRVARTIADLEGEDGVGPPHVAEAIGYRGGGVGR